MDWFDSNTWKHPLAPSPSHIPYSVLNLEHGDPKTITKQFLKADSLCSEISVA